MKNTNLAGFIAVSLTVFALWMQRPRRMLLPPPRPARTARLPRPPAGARAAVTAACKRRLPPPLPPRLPLPLPPPPRRRHRLPRHLQGWHHHHGHRARRVQRPRRRAEALEEQACRGCERSGRGRRPGCRRYPGPAPRLPATAMTAAKTSTASKSAPTATASNTDPTGATAKCKDGTYSKSQHHSGTCSSHGGVAEWLTAQYEISGSRRPPPSAAPCQWRKSGCSAGQTLSSNLGCPSSLGWMPSACMRSGTSAMSFSRKGTRGSFLSRARSL